MFAYLIRRLWQMIPTLLGVLLLVFFLFHWVGGDPAYILAGKISNPEQIATIRQQLGLDEPLYIQLWIYIKQVVCFDFGSSWNTGEAVSDIMISRLGPSLVLLIPLMILETAFAVTLGLLVAYVSGSLTDKMIMIVCTIGMSVSILVYIIVFQYGLAYQFGWFPIQGWDTSSLSKTLRYAALPILILLAVSIAPNLRLYRSFMLDEIRSDYVKTAKAKGLSTKRILWVHVLRNAAIPIVTYVMSNLPSLLVGAFLVERFFSIPGIGREIILAVERSDFPVIKAITVYVALATMFFNLAADVLYQKIDPRVRLR